MTDNAHCSMAESSSLKLTSRDAAAISSCAKMNMWDGAATGHVRGSLRSSGDFRTIDLKPPLEDR